MNERPEDFVPDNLRHLANQPRDMRKQIQNARDEYQGKIIAVVMILVGLVVAVALAALVGNALISMVDSVDPDSVKLVIGLIVGVPVYFVPTLVAGTRHRNQAAILALNLLLGWTIVGWVAALVWALYKERPQTSR